MQLDFLEPLLSAEDAEKADQFTVESLRLSPNDLMERAGLAIAKKVEALLANSGGTPPPVPVVIFCGPGNNGGDGWVVARRLWQNGVRAAIITLVDPESLKKEANIAAHQFLAAALNELWMLPDLNPSAQTIASGKAVFKFLHQTSPFVVVDAIFGTGLKRPADGLYAEVIQSINIYKTERRDALHLLSVDIPSGLPSDGQSFPGVHVRADTTVAIQFRKLTHLCGPHAYSCGAIECVDIGIRLAGPPAARALVATHQPPLELLRLPMPHYFKGSYGHVGVLLGSSGIQGASELACYSALRSGAGLVSVMIPSSAKTEIFLAPEIMRKVIASPLERDALERFTAFVIGTGVNESRYDVAHEIMTWATANSKPMVVDAGALALLKSLNTKTKPSDLQIIATPHPGEAARLLNMKSADVEADRVKTARALLSLFPKDVLPITWILKGTCPIVAHPEHGLIVCEGGVSTLSVGGSGDVLAGLCAALFAQTDSSIAAALLGVATHLEAGRNLLRQQSRGFLAHEIADAIPKVIFAGNNLA